MEKIKINPEEIFEEYEKGNEYKGSIGERGIIEQAKMNERFFVGDQWHGVQVGNSRPLVRRNVIKRIGEYKISTICGDNVAVNFSSEGEALQGTMSFLTEYFKSTAERLKLNDLLLNSVRDAYITGSSFLYTYWDEALSTGVYADEMKTTPIKGDIRCQVLNIQNIILGDPNKKDIQSQPYIIVSERMTQGQAKIQTEKNAEIFEASENKNLGDWGENEPEDSKRVTVLTKFFKDGDTVKAVRVTEKSFVKPLWDTGLSLYPIAEFIWQPRFSSGYGDSEVTYLIPNQIAINRALSAAVWSTMITGMPKVIVNRDLVEDAVTNDPGQIININGGSEYDVKNAICYVHPPQFASQLQSVVNDISEKTLSDSGANDAALGDLRPDNAAAIIAMREAALVPMQVYKNRFYTFCEDLARIWADFWIKMYGQRKVRIKGMLVPFNGDELRDLIISARVDVGASTVWGEAVTVTTLTNLLEKGIISKKQFLERLPKGIIPNIDGLIKEEEAIDGFENYQ